MKKILSLMLAVVMCLGLAACGGPPSPGAVVDQYLGSMKENAASSIEDLEKGDSSEFLDEFNLDKETLGNLGKETETEILGVIKKIADFDYEILNEEITKENEAAVVTVKITTYNLGEKFTGSFSNIMNDVMSLLMSGKSEEEVTNILMKKIFKDLNNAEKNFTTEVKIYLSYKDDNWVINENNDQLENAMTGNMEKAVESLDLF